MTRLVNQPTATPNRKIVWGGVALLASQAIAEVVLMQLPADTLVDAQLLIATVESGLTTVATFATAYFVRERA